MLNIWLKILKYRKLKYNYAKFLIQKNIINILLFKNYFNDIYNYLIIFQVKIILKNGQEIMKILVWFNTEIKKTIT